MRLQSPDDFDALLAESLQTDGTADCRLPLSSDAEFLEQLQQRLAETAVTPRVSPFWIHGVYRGIAAAAAGIVLFAGLNIIPPLLFRASLNGVGMVREKIIVASVQQEIVWQQFVAALKMQAKN